MNIDWSKAPELAGCVIRSRDAADDMYWFEQWGADDGRRCIFGQEDRPLRAWDRANTSGSHAWDLMATRPVSNVSLAWTVEGPPPVGTVCEMTTNDGHNWRMVKIIFFDDYVTLIGEPDGKVNRKLFKRCDADVAFRPIRTPEQIAADERTRAIDGLMKVTCISRGEAARIYDAVTENSKSWRASDDHR